MTGPTLSGQPRTVVMFETRIAASTTGPFAVFSRGQLQALTLNVSSLIAADRIDPEEWAVYNRELGFEILCSWMTADVNPGVSVQVELVEVTGASGLGTTSQVVLGGVVPGSSTPLRALNAGNTVFGPDRSGFFEIPSAGFYLPRLTITGTTAVNSATAMLGRLSALTR